MSRIQVSLRRGATLAAATSVICVACDEPAPLPPPQDVVILDEARWLKDGEAFSLKLDPGTYKLELTANNDGVTVEWVGAPCPGSGETRAYSTICEFSSTGQVVITNPTVFGAGLAASTTVKITKIARANVAPN